MFGKYNLNNTLLYLTIFSFIFQDFLTQEVFGTIARCPTIFILPFIAFIFISQKAIKATRGSRIYWTYYLITLFSSFSILLYVILIYGIYDFYQQNLLVKLVKNSSYTLVSCFVYMYLVSSVKNNRRDCILTASKFIFYILIVVGFIEMYNMHFFNNILRSNIEVNRIRLLTSEPSQAFPLFTVFFLLSLLSIKSNNKYSFYFIIYSILYSIVSLNIASKGGLLFVLVSITTSVGFYYHKSLLSKKSIKYVLLFLLVMSTISVYVYNNVSSMILVDIEKFSSFATRSITYFSTFTSLFNYPFGQGYGTYLFFMPQTFLESADIIDKTIGIPINSYEIDNIVKTGENLAVKAGILNDIVINGLFAVLFYFLMYKKYFTQLRNINNKKDRLVLLSLGVYILLTCLLGANNETLFYCYLPFAYLEV